MGKCNLHRRHSGSISGSGVGSWDGGPLHVKADHFSFGLIAVGVAVGGCVEKILDPADILISWNRLSPFR